MRWKFETDRDQNGFSFSEHGCDGCSLKYEMVLLIQLQNDTFAVRKIIYLWRVRVAIYRNTDNPDN